MQVNPPDPGGLAVKDKPEVFRLATPQQRARLSQGCLFLLLVLVVLIYLRALPGEFVWDDHTFFLDNDILPNLKPWNLKSIFLYPCSYWGENLPLTEFLFVLEYNLFGVFAPAYHVVSLVLYVLIGLVLWRLLPSLYRDLQARDSRSSSSPSDNAASVLVVLLLFLIHPIHVEVVAYITGQQHLLYSLFAFLAIHHFCCAFRSARLSIYRGLLPALLFYYLSVLAKYQAVSTALFIPALWLLLYRRKEDSLLKALGLWIAANIPVLAWMLWSIQGYRNVSPVKLALGEAILRAIRILGAHMVLAFKPHPLSFGYAFENSWSLDINFLVGASTLFALVCMLFWRRRSPATIGLLICVVYFFPMLQLVMGVSNATVYDRYVFVSLLGICMALERALASAFIRERRLGWAFLLPVCMVALTLGTLTYSYIPKFRSNAASLEHSYTSFPGWKRAAFDYTYVLIEAGRLDEAMELAETESTYSSPVWVRDYFRGWIHLERGDLSRAIAHLEKSSELIQRDGYFPFAAVPLARAYIQKGDLHRAERALHRVLNAPIHNPMEQYRAKALLEQIAGKIKRLPRAPETRR
jgi:tetratricopeptide (TPR) repeat protein